MYIFICNAILPERKFASKCINCEDRENVTVLGCDVIMRRGRKIFFLNLEEFLMFRRSTLIVLIALVGALALAACGGGGDPTDPPAAARTLNIDATEFAFSPADFSASVGEQLTFTIQNDGALEHNFAILDANGNDLARVEGIGVGESKSVSFTPSSAGALKLVCDIAGHEEAGMLGSLTVSE